MLFQQLDQKVLHIGALVVGDALAFQISHGLDRRAFGDDDRFQLGARYRSTGVHQRRTGGLGKDGGRFAHITEVNGTHIQGL